MHCALGHHSLSGHRFLLRIVFSHRHYLSCGTQESPQFSGKLSLQRYVGKEETSIGCPKRSPGLDEWEVRTGRAWTTVPLLTAWAQLLLVVIRLKYSNLSPPNPLFVFFLENWLPVPNCFWLFLHHSHLLSKPDYSCFTPRFQCLSVQVELKSADILSWWLCGFFGLYLPASVFSYV